MGSWTRSLTLSPEFLEPSKRGNHSELKHEGMGRVKDDLQVSGLNNMGGGVRVALPLTKVEN